MRPATARGAVAALALSGLLVAGEGRAEGWLVGVQGGAALEGPQGTIQGGGQAGLLVERRMSETYELGAGLSFVRDATSESEFDPRVTIVSLDFHGRRMFTDWSARPFLEAGLGFYSIDREAAGLGASTDAMAGGGSIGIGFAHTFSPRVALRVGAAYHAIAAEVASEGGGNLEDYFLVGATIVFAP